MDLYGSSKSVTSVMSVESFILPWCTVLPILFGSSFLICRLS